MMSKSDVAQEGQDTVRKSKDPSVTITANGTTDSTEEAHVCPCSIIERISRGTLTGLKNGANSYEWRTGQPSYVIKNGRTIRV